MNHYGWHFAAANGRLGFGDGRLIEEGGTLSVTFPLRVKGLVWRAPAVRAAGLHWCPDVMQALRYARGPVICRVRGWGQVHGWGGLVCGTHRKVLWMLPKAAGDEVLWAFARWCAVQVLPLRFLGAGSVYRRYLATGEPELRDGSGTAGEGRSWIACDLTSRGARVMRRGLLTVDRQRAQLLRMLAEARAGVRTWTWDVD